MGFIATHYAALRLSNHAFESENTLTLDNDLAFMSTAFAFGWSVKD